MGPLKCHTKRIYSVIFCRVPSRVFNRVSMIPERFSSLFVRFTLLISHARASANCSSVRVKDSFSFPQYRDSQYLSSNKSMIPFASSP